MLPAPTPYRPCTISVPSAHTFAVNYILEASQQRPAPASWGACWHNLANRIESFRCGGSAAFMSKYITLIACELLQLSTHSLVLPAPSPYRLPIQLQWTIYSRRVSRGSGPVGVHVGTTWQIGLSRSGAEAVRPLCQNILL